MTDASFEIEKLKIDAELKKEEYRQGVRKVIYGTMVVGVAAALFPFAQKVAESVFAAKIEGIRSNSAIQILQEENRLAKDLADKQNALALSQLKFEQDIGRQKANRVFLQSLATEARSEDLSKRITLAEFYSFLADGEEREQWVKFRDHLYMLQTEFGVERAVLQAVITDPTASRAAQIWAQAQIARIDQLESPVIAEASASAVSSEALVKLALADVERKQKRLEEAELKLSDAKGEFDDAVIALQTAQTKRDTVNADANATAVQKQEAENEVAFQEQERTRAQRAIDFAQALRNSRQQALVAAQNKFDAIRADTARITTQYGVDSNSARITSWLRASGNRARLKEWIESEGLNISTTSFVFSSGYAGMWPLAIQDLNIP